jgi:hypothetical protein
MVVEDTLPLVEEILGPRSDLLGGDYAGYRNHVYRMLNFCFALRECTEEERRKMTIAGCFHDIGIWTGGTFDYLPPSIEAARDYLESNGLEEWCPEVQLMIDEHHKLRKFRASESPLVEVFRKGDLVDFSLGILRCGLSKEQVKAVKSRFPNAGFHKMVARQELGWIVRHPWRPVPVARW